jgi:glycosyltransferase involved in cell wall biosynthesis
MKIYFDNVNFASRSGPNTFAIRLAKQLHLMGHDPFVSNEDYDIAIVFIQPTSYLNLKKPFVQRCDGIWSKKENFQQNNSGIKWTYDHANAVVIQSRFDFEFIKKHFGWQKQEIRIIGNGIDFQEIIDANKKNTLSLKTLRSNYNQILVASSNWHPQKRLDVNYELFKHIRQQNIKNDNTCLIVMGSNAHLPEDKTIRPHVFMTGDREHEDCLQIYSQSDYMLHMCFGDHMPNTVCEAVACGLPIICSNVGGTKEIIYTHAGDYGFKIKEKENFKFDLFDYDFPPQIDVTQFKGFDPKFDQYKNEAQQRLDIKLIAKQYEQLLLSLI